MGWRTLFISKTSSFSLKQQQLIIQQGEDQIQFAVEDLSTLVLDTQQTQISGSLLSFLAANNVTLITCDQKHLPNGILCPFSNHSRFSEIVKLQSNWTEPFKKRCWQRIICQKILNQSQVLTHIGSKTSEDLQSLAKSVRPGDPDNYEAQAARMYWKKLFGGEFRREPQSDELKNNALNYGYAVLRAALSRVITAHGLLPAFGLHHHNKLNAFNLADDLIEPFRPVVDLKVLDFCQQLHFVELNKEYRAELVQLLYETCHMGKQEVDLQNAMEAIVVSLVQATREKNHNLLEVPVL